MAHNTTASAPLTVEAAATEFLKRNQFEEGFQALCQLARECYPELLYQEAELVEDVDEPGRRYVHVITTLPKDFPVEVSLERKRAYYRQVVQRVPHAALEYLCHLVTYAPS